MSKIVTQSGFYATKQANKIESIAADSKVEFNKLWLWPASGISAAVGSKGTRIPNVGNIYIGERTDSEDVTPDVVATGDLPMVIELPQGENKMLRDVLIQADNLGDGVYYKFWTA